MWTVDWWVTQSLTPAVSESRPMTGPTEPLVKSISGHSSQIHLASTISMAMGHNLLLPCMNGSPIRLDRHAVRKVQ